MSKHVGDRVEESPLVVKIMSTLLFYFHELDEIRDAG